MTQFFSLYIFSVLLNAVNAFYLYKKYQLTAGTSLWANTVYLIINGVVSAIFPIILLLIRGERLQYSTYSFLVALAIVICSALGTISHMKAYAMGKIATVNVLSTVGGIVLSCTWGILVLRESLSLGDAVAIGIMLFSTVLIRAEKSKSTGKGTLHFYLTVIFMIFLGSAVSILNKQHQVEANFATIDTLSFSVWVALIRTVLFSIIAVMQLFHPHKTTIQFPKSVFAYAAVSSLISGGCYIITLFTSTVLPIVITSPLGTGLNILLSTLFPWIFYRESLNKTQIAGVLLSFAGVIMFLI